MHIAHAMCMTWLVHTHTPYHFCDATRLYTYQIACVWHTQTRSYTHHVPSGWHNSLIHITLYWHVDDLHLCINESCHTHQRVVTRIYTSHVMHHDMYMNASRYMYIPARYAHGMCMMESCHTHERVVSRIWTSHVMRHGIYMSHARHVCEWVMVCVWTSHVIRVVCGMCMNETCHKGYVHEGCVTWLDESCHTHTWTCHGLVYDSSIHIPHTYTYVYEWCIWIMRVVYTNEWWYVYEEYLWHDSSIYVTRLVYAYAMQTALQKRPTFCQETYHFKEPANRSHPISVWRSHGVHMK